MKGELEHGATPRAGSFPGVSLGAPASRALELRDLRGFHSVARTGNFARAARELNISQPNVSYQVQKLEQELGAQLVIRHRRGVTLTQAGSCLMERLDVPFLATLPSAFIASAAIGLVLERLLYRHLYARGHLDQVMFSIGLVFMACAATDWLCAVLAEVGSPEDVDGGALPPGDIMAPIL